MSEELNRRRFLWATGAVGIAGLAGCGGDNSNDSGTQTSSPTSGSTDTRETPSDTPTESSSDQSYDAGNGVLDVTPSLKEIFSTIENSTVWDGDMEDYESFPRDSTLSIVMAEDPKYGEVSHKLSNSLVGTFGVAPNNGSPDFGGDIYEEDLSGLLNGLDASFVEKNGYQVVEEPQLVGDSSSEVIVGIKEMGDRIFVPKVRPSDQEDLMTADEGYQWIDNILTSNYRTQREDTEDYLAGGEGSGNMAMNVAGALIATNSRIKGTGTLPLIGENGLVATNAGRYRPASEYTDEVDR
jgi:hypothetical protein